MERSFSVFAATYLSACELKKARIGANALDLQIETRPITVTANTIEEAMQKFVLSDTFIEFVNSKSNCSLGLFYYDNAEIIYFDKPWPEHLPF